MNIETIQELNHTRESYKTRKDYRRKKENIIGETKNTMINTTWRVVLCSYKKYIQCKFGSEGGYIMTRAVLYTVGGVEILDNTEFCIERLNTMKRMEKCYNIRKERKKRKERIESIKLFLVLMFFNVIIPMVAFCHWIVCGY